MSHQNNADQKYSSLISELRRMCDRKKRIIPSYIKKVFIEENYTKGGFFIRAGEIPEKLGFVSKGMFKYYYIDPDGNEWIKHFSAESDFVASYAALLSGTPSPYFIEAMEKATVLSIKRQVYLENIKTSHLWCDIARQYTEKIYSEKEKREASLLQEDGTQRYLSFRKEYAKLADRITLKDTASFLGLTPVSLSRIRKKSPGINK